MSSAATGIAHGERATPKPHPIRIQAPKIGCRARRVDARGHELRARAGAGGNREGLPEPEDPEDHQHASRDDEDCPDGGHRDPQAGRPRWSRASHEGHGSHEDDLQPDPALTTPSQIGKPHAPFSPQDGRFLGMVERPSAQACPSPYPVMQAYGETDVPGAVPCRAAPGPHARVLHRAGPAGGDRVPPAREPSPRHGRPIHGHDRRRRPARRGDRRPGRELVGRAHPGGRGDACRRCSWTPARACSAA